MMAKKSKKRPPADVPVEAMREAVRVVLAGDATIADVAVALDAPTYQVSGWVREERARRAAERASARVARAAEPAARLGEIFGAARLGEPLPIEDVARAVARLPAGLVEIHVGGDLLRLDTRTIAQALAPRRWATELSACVEYHPRAVGPILRVDWIVAHLRMRGGLRLVSCKPLRRDGIARDVSAVVRLGGV